MRERVELVFEGSCLVVALLPGSQAIQREWSQVDSQKLIAAMEAVDAQKLPSAWVATATRRIERARDEGHLDG